FHGSERLGGKMGEARGAVVQPHGVLLTLDEPSLRVLQASANVTELLRRPAERLIGAPVEGVLGQAVRSALEGVNGTSLEGQPLYVGTIPIGQEGLSQPYEAIAHRVDGVLVLELEPTDSPARAQFHELYPLVRTFLGRLANVATTEELTRIAAR